VFGRLTQCRTGHGYIGEFYAQIVPDENVDCPCGERFQTREHILRECPRYERHRDILRKVSRDVSLPEILSTKKGIKALSDFLINTGAFTKTGAPRQKKSTLIYEDAPDDEDEDAEEI